MDVQGWLKQGTYLVLAILVIFADILHGKDRCSDGQYWKPLDGCNDCADLCSVPYKADECDYYCNGVPGIIPANEDDKKVPAPVAPNPKDAPSTPDASPVNWGRIVGGVSGAVAIVFGLAAFVLIQYRKRINDIPGHKNGDVEMELVFHDHEHQPAIPIEQPESVVNSDEEVDPQSECTSESNLLLDTEPKSDIGSDSPGSDLENETDTSKQTVTDPSDPELIVEGAVGGVSEAVTDEPEKSFRGSIESVSKIPLQVWSDDVGELPGTFAGGKDGGKNLARKIRQNNGPHVSDSDEDEHGADGNRDNVVPIPPRDLLLNPGQLRQISPDSGAIPKVHRPLSQTKNNTGPKISPIEKSSGGRRNQFYTKTIQESPDQTLSDAQELLIQMMVEQPTAQDQSDNFALPDCNLLPYLDTHYRNVIEPPEEGAVSTSEVVYAHLDVNAIYGGRIHQRPRPANSQQTPPGDRPAFPDDVNERFRNHREDPPT